LLSRMGKGCGVIKSWVAIIKKGTVVIEVDGISQDFAKQVLKAAGIRLPLQVCIISRCV
jgi:large subunit ribosomal protein L16